MFALQMQWFGKQCRTCECNEHLLTERTGPRAAAAVLSGLGQAGCGFVKPQPACAPALLACKHGSHGVIAGMLQTQLLSNTLAVG